MFKEDIKLRENVDKKPNYKQWAIVALLVLIIAAIIYFMVITKKKNEEYNVKLQENITRLLDSNKTYYIKDYDKDDSEEYSVKKFKSVVLLGYDKEKPGVVSEVDKFGEVKDEGYAFVAERIGKDTINVTLKKPIVLSHEIASDLEGTSVTETNEVVSSLKRKIEKDLISSKDQKSIFNDTKEVLKAYLIALGYKEVKILEK